MPNVNINRRVVFSGNQNFPVPIGELVNNDFAGSFSTKGTHGSTVNANNITFNSAGPNFNFNNGIYYNDLITLSEGVIFKSVFTIDNKATSSGFAPQIVTSSGGAMYSAMLSVNAGFLGDGTFNLYDSGLTIIPNPPGTGITGIPVVTGDVFSIELEFTQTSLIARCWNNSTPGTVHTITANRKYPTGGASTTPTNLHGAPYENYKIGWATNGGQFTLTNFSLTSTQYKGNGVKVIIGDSKTSFYYPGSYAATISALLRADNPTKRIYAESNPGGNTPSVLLRDYLMYGAADYIFWIGCNGTVQAVSDFPTLISQVHAVGGRAIFAKSAAENRQNVVAFNASATAILGWDLVIDTFTPTWNGVAGDPIPSMIDIDGIHLNSTAYTALKSTFQIAIDL